MPLSNVYLRRSKRFSHVLVRTIQSIFRQHRICETLCPPTYDWHGNIRELQNVIERAVILCAGDTFAIEERWLKRDAPQPAGPAVSLVAARATHERALIEAA